MNRRQTLLHLSALGLLGTAALPAVAANAASDYPKSLIKLVIPYPPGGPTDLVGRLVAMAMGDTLKQTIFIDNKPGASGMVGAAQVAKSPPDGYTLLANASLHVINPSVYDKVPYDSFNDFAPITQIVDVPLVLVVNSEIPVSNVQELISYLKKSKATINFTRYSLSCGGTDAACMAVLRYFQSDALKLLRMYHQPYKRF